jgi:hypothetical protein
VEEGLSIACEFFDPAQGYIAELIQSAIGNEISLQLCMPKPCWSLPKAQRELVHFHVEQHILTPSS